MKLKEDIMKSILSLFLCLIVFLSFIQLQAGIHKVINYQGVLMDTNEQPVPEDVYQITFNIYDEPGTLLWTETHAEVPVMVGVFQVLLGTVTPLDLPFDKPYFLGIQVGSDPELEPRMALTSAAYSFNAGSVSGETNVFPSDGSVGIGTTNPENGKLEVISENSVAINASSSSSNTISATSSAGGGYAAGRFSATGEGTYGIWTQSDEYDALYASSSGPSSAAVRAVASSGAHAGIFTGGHVGIGVSDPEEMLEVGGIVHSVSGGFMFPDGTIQTTATTGSGTPGNFIKKDIPDTSRGTTSIPMLLISNLGDGDGINGRSTSGDGISGRSDNQNGTVGWTGASDMSGIFGFSTDGRGVVGRSDNNDGTVGWTGASDKSGVFGHSTEGIGVTGNSTNNYGIQAQSTNTHSLYIPNAGGAGIRIDNATLNGIDVGAATHEGVLVRGAGRSGVLVGSATWNGLEVTTAGRDGVRVEGANWSGIYVASSGADAIRVQTAGQDGLRFYEGVTRDYIRAGSDADLDFRVTNDGTAYADGGWQGAADFAELIETEGFITNYEPGDVLVISNNQDRAVKLSNQSYATNIMGVYSTKPGFVGSTHPMETKYEKEIPVAITGIVPCKVTTENGPIKRGDLLTSSSKPGYAMKATEHKVGTILGKALQSLDSGTGKIEVLIILQ
jgi:hypothetical protein